MSGPERELPLRVVDTPGGVVVRALCGAEPASQPGPAARALTADGFTPAAVLRMVVHAKTCQACANLALERARRGPAR